MGAIVVERKYFTCPSRESNPDGWIYWQTLYHIAVKAAFYHKAVAVFLIEILQYLDPVTYSSGLLLHNIHMWPDLAMPVKVYIQYQGVLVLKFGRKKKQGKKLWHHKIFDGKILGFT